MPYYRPIPAAGPATTSSIGGVALSSSPLDPSKPVVLNYGTNGIQITGSLTASGGASVTGGLAVTGSSVLSTLVTVTGSTATLNIRAASDGAYIYFNAGAGDRLKIYTAGGVSSIDHNYANWLSFKYGGNEIAKYDANGFYVTSGTLSGSSGTFKSVTINGTASLTGVTGLMVSAALGFQPISPSGTAANADTIDGYHAAIAATANTVVVRDAASGLTGSGGSFSGAVLAASLGQSTIGPIGPTSVTNPENGLMNILFSAIAAGKSFYLDEEFAVGNNSVGVYNNSGGGAVTITREADSQAPNRTGYRLTFVHNGGTTSPGYGGFIAQINSAANRTFVQRFRAKLPVGYTFNMASNSQGTNADEYWLTPNIGTGKWEEYIRVSHCGNTGTFSSGGHVYITGPSATFTWYMASCNVYEIQTSGLSDILQNGFTTSGPISGSLMKLGNGYTAQAGDLGVARAGGTTGVVYFNAAGDRYLYYDGTYFQFGGASVKASDFTATSDSRLKTDVETLTGSLCAVNALRGVRYTRKETGSTEVGVIAQEVRQVVPELVHGDESKEMLSVSYDRVVALLIEAVKELSAQVDDLKKSR